MPAPRPNVVLPALFIGGLVAAGTYQVGRIIRPNVDNGAAPVPVDNSQGSMVLRGWGEITGQQLRPLNDIFADALAQQEYASGALITSTDVQGRIAKVATPNNILSPDNAYKAVQAGQLGGAAAQKMSEYFYWSEFFNASKARYSNKKDIPLSVYKNAANLARELDRLRAAYGNPISIVSWYRYDSSTYHGKGMAVDINGPYAMKKQLDTIATQIGWKGGQGLSAGNSAVPKLHLDIGPDGRGWWYKTTSPYNDYGSRRV